MLTFTPDNVRKAARYQSAIADLILRINRDEKPDVALLVVALTRCSQELLDKYPPKLRAELVELINLCLRPGGGAGPRVTLN